MNFRLCNKFNFNEYTVFIFSIVFLVIFIYIQPIMHIIMFSFRKLIVKVADDLEAAFLFHFLIYCD